MAASGCDARASAPSYTCVRARTAPLLGGEVTGAAWDAAPWSAAFVDIECGNGRAARALPAECGATRVKLLWDERYLYVGAWLPDTAVIANVTTRNAQVFMDNDFEVFLDPDGAGGNYYELEVNARGTTWQLSLDRPYARGGTATSPRELDGLRVGVAVDGVLNEPAVVDRGWSVTVALPFAALVPFGARAPPRRGDVWRANFSRVHWQHDVVDGQYVRVPPLGTSLPQGEHEWHPERNIVWAPTGVVDIHRPDKWGAITFAE